MKNNLKIVLIFVVLLSSLLATSIPAYATAGWGEMEEEAEWVLSIAFIVTIILFLPVLLIELVVAIPYYLISGTFLYDGIILPIFRPMLQSVFVFIIALLTGSF